MSFSSPHLVSRPKLEIALSWHGLKLDALVDLRSLLS